MTFEYKTIDPDFFYKQFCDVATDMQNEFNRLKRDAITNKTDEGEHLEHLLIRFLNTYLPKKLAVGRGYIMNGEGKTSLQQDVVVYDPNNYVLLKNTEGYQVFPVECVSATIEVKSTLTKKTLQDSDRNATSIKYLSGTQLLVHRETGEIHDIQQYGSVVFSSIFAFQSDSTLETCANNFKELCSGADFVFILDKGLVCYVDNENKVNDGMVSIRTTTTPSREKDGIMFLEAKKSQPNGVALAFLIEHIVSHTEKNIDAKGRYSLYNYFKMPRSLSE
jgi:hypothetical protein